VSAKNKQYGIAVIACGARGKAHAAAWAKLPNVSIKVVTDPDREREQALAEQYGADRAEDYKQAIARDDVDIVSVCTPACSHADPTVFAAEHGKHILCEKPMALTLEDGDRMTRAAEKNNVKLTFSFQAMYSQATEKLRELMADGGIGRPVMARIITAAEIRPKLAMMDKNGNNGPIVDICPHTFRLWRYIFQSEPVRVKASGMVISKDAEELKVIKERAIDTGTLLVDFASGDVGVYSITWGLPHGIKPHGLQDILGPRGVIYPGQKQIRIVREGNEETVIGDLEYGGDNEQVARFLKCIEEDTEPFNTARDARIGLQLSLAALESIETGKAVEVSV